MNRTSRYLPTVVAAVAGGLAVPLVIRAAIGMMMSFGSAAVVFNALAFLLVPGIVLMDVIGGFDYGSDKLTASAAVLNAGIWGATATLFCRLRERGRRLFWWGFAGIVLWIIALIGYFVSLRR